MRILTSLLVTLAIATACASRPAPSPGPAPGPPPPAYGPAPGPAPSPPPTIAPAPGPAPVEGPDPVPGPGPGPAVPAISHDFYYFPDLEAYHCASCDEYFWRHPMSGWEESEYAPSHLEFTDARRVSVRLGGESPSDQDLARDRSQYPPSR